ncbi:MAG: thiamine phosphate synthase [Hyphomicrobiaceae bacterium]|nr:thiamine phosphate synthase [Hyphomicrobiaceae bacterium]
MAGANKPSKLYLVVETGPTAADRLAAALSGANPSSVLLVPSTGRGLDAQTLLPLIATLQNAGVAALVADDAQLARVTKADGVHLTWSKDIARRAEEAREILGARFIVGADVGRSRHDAMVIGETDIDYIAFGIPAHVEDRETARERRHELCQWWAEIFQVPCVAFDVTDVEEAADIVTTGVDFVAITIPDAMSAAEIRAFVQAADTALAAYEPTV